MKHVSHTISSFMITLLFPFLPMLHKWSRFFLPPFLFPLFRVLTRLSYTMERSSEASASLRIQCLLMYLQVSFYLRLYLWMELGAVFLVNADWVNKNCTLPCGSTLVIGYKYYCRENLFKLLFVWVRFVI